MTAQTAQEEAAHRAATRSLLAQISGWCVRLAQESRCPSGHAGELEDEHRAAVAVRVVCRILFLRLCEIRGLEAPGTLLALAELPDVRGALERHTGSVQHRYGALFAPEDTSHLDESLLRALVRELYTPGNQRLLEAAPVETLGQVYEQCLACTARKQAKKAHGIYYTPAAIAERVLAHTLDQACKGRSIDELASLRLVDPSCGSGMFLVRAYARLLDIYLDIYLNIYFERQPSQPAQRRDAPIYQTALGTWALCPRERQRILRRHIHGVEQDPHALEIARLSLALKALEAPAGALPAARGQQGHVLAGPLAQEALEPPGELEPGAWPVLPHGAWQPGLADNLKHGNSLVAPGAHLRPGRPGEPELRGFDWSAEFPWVATGGFDVVVGNPPWGQKAVAASHALKQYLRQRYPSSRGIFDWFRPFLELGIQLTRKHGYFGMVLPDIVLLKNYEPTRRYLLDELALTNIEWLGMAFAGATIDVVTIAGRKHQAPPGHRVDIQVHEPPRALAHSLLQADFLANPRCTLNLFLTQDKRHLVTWLRRYPRLGEYFDAHEGIHSGNIRRELFVDARVDGSCRELYFGRGELGAHGLRWAGRYVRLAALPQRRTRERYANLGQPAWHESPKILVRRTGDTVTAAVDEHARYASNNFFLVLPRQDSPHQHPLGLYGLCALLNSQLVTRYLRIIEPREKRVFAEIKIKHLSDFPLPHPSAARACAELDALGRERALVAAQAHAAHQAHAVQDAHQVATLAARAAELDQAIEARVHEAFSLGPRAAQAGYGPTAPAAPSLTPEQHAIDIEMPPAARGLVDEHERGFPSD